MSIYIYGHTNPDSDSIIASISLAYLKNKLGEDAISARQGGLNPESEWILEKFNIKAPELIIEYKDRDVWIVDHSDLAQSPIDIKEANILGIVDHHKLGDITTTTPLECWIRPVGCTCTIIKEMFDFHNVEVPKEIAGAMLCAILSDTVIYKSPTCTDKDIKACRELASIAKIDDITSLGMEMFIVKSAVDGASARELTTRDFKDFNMGKAKIGIGQLEVVDLSTLDSIKKDLFADINKLKEEGNRHTVLLLLTDIMKEGSQILIASDDDTLVEKAFGVKPKSNEAWLDGVMSRKKQIVPNLEKLFQ